VEAVAVAEPLAQVLLAQGLGLLFPLPQVQAQGWLFPLVPQAALVLQALRAGFEQEFEQKPKLMLKGTKKGGIYSYTISIEFF
jgi:hypothetical protein